MDVSGYGFVRALACAPPLALANPAANAERIAAAFRWAADEGAALLVTPELGLTGYTCQDLFLQDALLDAALAGLATLLAGFGEAGIPPPIGVVGLPLAFDGRLFNCAVAIQGDRILGIVPKTHLPNYGEFYDKRFFSPARDYAGPPEVDLLGRRVPFGTDLIFIAPNLPAFALGIEICEDAWAPIPCSARLSLAGATVIANPSASNELIGKAEYRRDVIVTGHSATSLCAYVYAGAGPGESSSDTVFGGHCLIAENGSLLAESERFRLDERSQACQDVDLQRVALERRRMGTFGESHPGAAFRRVVTGAVRRLSAADLPLRRAANPTPFVPRRQEERAGRCREIFHIQTTALARRSRQMGAPRFVLGVSGGLDSTLALLVCSRTLQLLGREAQDLVAVTMPGFGTSARTKGNAVAIVEALTGHPPSEIDIRPACRQHLTALKHPAHEAIASVDDAEVPEAALDVAFENAQARERTQILMDLANQVGGLVVGTGDLSEMALGWNTYNGDHMSMYAVNCGVPKTLVQYVVRWAAEEEFSGHTREVLLDILATPISPELLPTRKGQIAQETEVLIGPYVLHDYFLFHLARAGAPPGKILLLAQQAFKGRYQADEIRHWLELFLRRFFANQFKRNCVPDGPKVGTVSLSPRADWRMPSDAQATAWLDDMDV